MATGRHPCDDAALRLSGGGEGAVAVGPGAMPEAEAPEASVRRWVLVTSVLGSSVAFVLSSVVNVALPAMGRDLGAGPAETQWILNAYLLPLAALILVGGALGDRLGRTRVFAWGTALMTAATVACGLAPEAGWLIAARAVQGVGAALLVPGSLALLRAFYPDGERGRAIGTWAGAAALTSAAGPLLGGWLVDAFSWRWVFFVVVPLAAGAFALAVWKVPESKPEGDDEPLDWPGAVLAALGLGALTVGLIRQSEAGWGDALVLGGIGAGVALLAAFLWRERRATNPMLPLALFASRTFAGANALTVALYFALGAMSFLLPFYLINVLGYTATQAGAAFLPFTILMGGASRWVGGHIETLGTRPLLTLGPALASGGLALFATLGAESTYLTGVLPPMLLLAAGMTLAVAPLTTVVMEAVTESHAGTASGVNNAASRVAQLVAVAAAGAIALGVARAEVSSADLSGLSPQAREAVVASAEAFGAAPPEALSEPERARVREVSAGAFVVGFRWTLGVAAGLALLAAGLAWWTVDPEEPPAG